MKPEHENILNALIAKERDGTLHGAFDSIPIEIYHHPRCPGVSSTRIKAIVATSFKHAALKPFESTPEMIFGTAFHAYMEAESEFAAKYSVGKMDPVRTYLAFDDLYRIKKMADNVRNHPVAKDLVAGSTAEWTFFALDPLSGVLRKCRPDLFKDLTIADYKSCFDASPKVFSYQAKKLMYRISAQYYLDVARCASGRDFNEFKFIAVESQGLHEVAVYPVDDRSMIHAQEEIQGALNAIAAAQIGGWTGYALNQSPILI